MQSGLAAGGSPSTKLLQFLPGCFSHRIAIGVCASEHQLQPRAARVERLDGEVQPVGIAIGRRCPGWPASGPSRAGSHRRLRSRGHRRGRTIRRSGPIRCAAAPSSHRGCAARPRAARRTGPCAATCSASEWRILLSDQLLSIRRLSLASARQLGRCGTACRAADAVSAEPG